PAKFPLAALRTFLRRARPGTTVLARGMVGYLPIRRRRTIARPRADGGNDGWGSAFAEHAQHAGLVHVRHRHHAAEVALARPPLADHAVALPGLGAHRLAGSGHFEPLGSGPIRLHFGHRHSWDPASTRGALRS